ncbi:MAG: hypothetical protein L6W00_26855 [Lentisphaeria bacterium]|nr:MAG: hypothetical protein L6W00_26855 [Lentisphaeria bacterium]
MTILALYTDAHDGKILPWNGGRDGSSGKWQSLLYAYMSGTKVADWGFFGPDNRPYPPFACPATTEALSPRTAEAVFITAPMPTPDAPSTATRAADFFRMSVTPPPGTGQSVRSATPRNLPQWSTSTGRESGPRPECSPDAENCAA